MSLIVYGIEPKQTYLSLMDYLSRKNVKVLSCHEPSVIRVEFGSFVSWATGNKKGKANFVITKRNLGSYVNLNFDFSISYGLGLIIALVAAILVFGVGLMMYSSLAHATIILGLIALLAFVCVMAIIDYGVSDTEEKFLNELNTFLGSLSAEKGRLVRRLENSNGIET